MFADIKTVYMTSKLGLESKSKQSYPPELLHSSKQIKGFDFQLGGNFIDRTKYENIAVEQKWLRIMNISDIYSGIMHRICPFNFQTIHKG
ncbi:hypothetical protein HKD37_12G034092 [Glycine soja]|uniref:Uncharacterized protein n=1 Tax=Glycine max TaxID=3847 RepID=A0A0R0HHV8_SOYBN|nr:hypothetical protein GYH30_033646 [Glycine max]